MGKAAKTATGPAADKKKPVKKDKSTMRLCEVYPTLFEKKAVDYSQMTGVIQPKRDLRRFVRWPAYVRLQRQKKILISRLKMPPSINQFNFAIDKSQATGLLKMMQKYRPESRKARKVRLLEMAKTKKEGGEVSYKRPVCVTFGLEAVTKAVERKSAKLVVICHDCDPIDLVIWLPTLCRKMDIPYCIFKGRARLGAVVHKKTCLTLCFTDVRGEDRVDFDKMCVNFRGQFNDNVEARRQWGGHKLSNKSMLAAARKERILRIEQAKKLGLNLGA